MQNKSVIKSVLAGLAFLGFYLLVVILTTPNYSPFTSAMIALRLNGIYIYSGAISIALQIWIMEYSKSLGTCDLPAATKKKASVLNLLSGIASSFFSFFGLVAVGCCGTWIFILSFLPGIVGVGLSSILIRYSTLLAQIGLGVMIASNVYALLKLRQRIEIYKGQALSGRIEITPKQSPR
jgi:hypothetical protein